MPSTVPVQEPDGSFSYVATQHEAKQLIRAGLVTVIGSRVRINALRLKRRRFEKASEVYRDIRPEHVAGLPCIRAHELLAPSPRRHFGSIKSVHQDMRTAPQSLRAAAKKAASAWGKKRLKAPELGTELNRS